MSLKNIRTIYKVPAYRGVRVQYKDSYGAMWYGTITSEKNNRLQVLIDDRKQGYRGRKSLHPTYRIKYLTDRKI